MFHVDDLKISYVDENVVTEIIDKPSAIFGTIIPLSMSRGRVHDYLGMTFDYTNTGKLMITMYDYIEDITEGASEIYKTGVGSATPASEHLFEIREPNEEDNELLSKE